MKIEIKKPGTVSINEEGCVILAGWDFAGEGESFTARYCGLAALEYIVERFKMDPDQLVVDRGNNTLDGLTGPLPVHFLK